MRSGATRLLQGARRGDRHPRPEVGNVAGGLLRHEGVRRVTEWKFLHPGLSQAISGNRRYFRGKRSFAFFGRLSTKKSP